MKNYKRLGDYIREVNVRNRELEVKILLGLSVSKEFMPSIANTIGTDMSTYKIVERGQMVYIADTSRRGDKIAIGLLDEYEKAIVSQAYTVFEIINHEQLLPKYLMMWFRRPEFDRYARFHSHGSAREVFDWDELCDVMLPIPSITRQREIVAEYETLTRRIRINEQMIQHLEVTAQALYRKMFVDGIDKENLPEEWRMGTLEDLVEIIDGDRGVNYPKDTDLYPIGYCLFLNAGNVTSKGFNFDNKLYITEEKSSLMRAGKLKRNDIIFTTRGTVGNFALYSNEIPFEHMRINSGMVILRSSILSPIQYVYNLFHLPSFKQDIINYLSGSAQPQLPIKDFNRIPIIIPAMKLLDMFSNKSLIINKKIDVLKNENYKLVEIQSLLLAKMGL